MAELRDAWHKFAAGQMGPDGVVAVARRACGAGVQLRAPSLVHLANLQPTQYGQVSDLFSRVRGELQTAAQTVQQPQYQPQAQSQPQPQMLQPQAAYASGGAVAYPATAPPPGAYRMGAPGPPAPYAVAPGYDNVQPGAPVYVQPQSGLPPGVHGITLQEFKDLRRVGWICAVAGLLIPLFEIMAIVNGSKLSKHGDSQGTPMMVIGIVVVALTVLVLAANAGGS